MLDQQTTQVLLQVFLDRLNTGSVLENPILTLSDSSNNVLCNIPIIATIAVGKINVAAVQESNSIIKSGTVSNFKLYSKSNVAIKSGSVALRVIGTDQSNLLLLDNMNFVEGRVCSVPLLQVSIF